VQGAITKNVSSGHNQHSYAQASTKTHHPSKKLNNTSPAHNIYTATKSTPNGKEIYSITNTPSGNKIITKTFINTIK
jgi:hypothetical protein